MREPRVVITALVGNPTRTNLELAYAWRTLGVDARILFPWEALRTLGGEDVAITRLDVLPTLDGIEPGLEHVARLADKGVRVLNRPEALLAAHDKLLTAERLIEAGLPTPATGHIQPGGPLPPITFPCVVKPRFGSWGQDIFRCDGEPELAHVLALAAARPWWGRHGALVQELVGSTRSDVRIVVAGNRVVAAARRRAAEDEWRTNVTLGGTVVKAELPAGTAAIALRAADALGIDFASVDLLPVEDGWVVLELNGAVDFDSRYALPGLEPYAAILEGLGIAAEEMTEAERAGTLGVEHRKEGAMTKTVQGQPPRVGDEILITGHSVGDAPRTAVILEILGEPGHERFRVRWEDGHESIFFPADDAIIRHPQRRAKARA